MKRASEQASKEQPRIINRKLVYFQRGNPFESRYSPPSLQVMTARAVFSQRWQCGGGGGGGGSSGGGGGSGDHRELYHFVSR